MALEGTRMDSHLDQVRLKALVNCTSLRLDRGRSAGRTSCIFGRIEEMHKLSLLAGVAVAAIGMASFTSGSAFAACLNQTLPPISLAQSAMVPNAGFEYDKAAYDAQAAKGNYCGVTQQSYATSDNRYENNSNEPVPNATAHTQVQ